jgi:DNA polymerase III alpha subunit
MDYFKAMKPLADKGIPQIYSTLEHGWQGNYFHIYDDLEKFNKANSDANKNYKPIKFIFGVEAYWVHNHKDKDSTNNHIVLLAKNENGRKALNRAIAKSYISKESLEKGIAQEMFPEVNNDDVYYYYKNRMDMDLLLSLPKDDIFVTSACIAFWLKYSNDGTYWDIIDNDVLQLSSHFTDFYLEIQANNTESQKMVNEHIMELHNKYGIPIIAGCDSHYISNDQKDDREYLLKSNAISYPEEDGNYMDFPSYDTLVNRFNEQGIVPLDKVYEAIDNTNKILDFDDIVLDRTLKVPVAKMFKDKTQEERNQIFINILKDEWKKQRSDINESLLEEYQKEIKHDINEIISCNMADYFIDDYYIVKRGVEKYNGIITPTGRGSSVSMFLNKLLGLTKVDKVNSPVTMYSERFLTASRILDSKTPPDIDNNISSREPFIKAQRDIIGNNTTFDLIAFGTLKYKSAFKMYSRANEVEPSVANEITKQINKYENAIKHMSEDETEDDYDIFDYVDKNKYGYLIDGCQKYRGIVDTLKGHPCATLMYNGNAIEDIGVIMVKSESTKKEVWVALQESATMDSFGLVKNDWLVVDSIGLTYDIYKEIGMTPMTINELLKEIEHDEKTWDIYKNGYTMCINQVEQQKSTEKVMRFKPKNIYELCQFVAGIRPSFQTMYKTLESRTHFDYGIKAFDDLLQDKYCDSSFILYQESLMKVLGFAGFPMGETYTIIKAISKKKKYVIENAKKKFIPNFTKAILDTKETDNEKEAEQTAHKVWKIIEDSASYGFNCSHSYCMALDSVTLAWLKAHYPYEFYKVTLQRYTDKGDKNKVTKLKKEMSNLGISLKPIKFGDDNRQFSISKDKSYISQTMASIKDMEKVAPIKLYELSSKRHYDNFLQLLFDIKTKRVCDSKSLDILIKLDYFSEFGDINYLLKVVEIYNKYIGKNDFGKRDRKQFRKNDLEKFYPIEREAIEKFTTDVSKNGNTVYVSRQNIYKLVKYLCDNLKRDTTDIYDKVVYEAKYLGYTSITVPNSPYCVVESIDEDSYGRRFAHINRLSDGSKGVFRCSKVWYNEYGLEQGQLIKAIFDKKPKKIQNEKGKWVNSKTDFYWELSAWS